MKNLIIGQSGGPTSVINASLAGVYEEAKELGFNKIYGMINGIEGLLEENIIDLDDQRDCIQRLQKSSSPLRRWALFYSVMLYWERT